MIFQCLLQLQRISVDLRIEKINSKPCLFFHFPRLLAQSAVSTDRGFASSTTPTGYSCWREDPICRHIASTDFLRGQELAEASFEIDLVEAIRPCIALRA